MIAAVLACMAGVVLVVLSVKIIGRMRARGAWALFSLWLVIGIGGLELIANADLVPLPVASLLLLLALVLWSQRHRWTWKARQASTSLRVLSNDDGRSVVGAGKK